MLARLRQDTSGAAAAEMALVAPLLIALMLGSMELGYYFYSEHVVVKAVRDGARFASRQGFDKYSCPNAVDNTLETEIRRVTRTNQVTSGGAPRLANWTSDASVSVSLSCVDNSSGDYGSFYTDYVDSSGTPRVPVVTVSASVAYSSLFELIGFRSSGLSLSAQSQAAVMGI
ncbi:MAG TPA: TadE/TadG family type IV pilus assembly protein [Sphingomicrobium sp.]|nr:TadE/TadG family type IV pilus assembly protein [Sphingomicrobium sp.]